MHAKGIPGRIRRKISWINFTCLHDEKNTKIFCVGCDFTNAHNVSIFFSTLQVVYICCNFGGVAFTDSACTLKNSGSFNDNRAKSLTFFVCVALNNNVCLVFGKFANTASKVSLKPKSNILSASSKTNTCNPVQSNIGVSSMCCNNLPGVQHNKFIAFTAFLSFSKSFPPMSKATLNV